MLLGASPQDTQAGYCKITQSIVQQPFIATANAGFRREVFAELGNFDSRCVTGEDMDFSFRILKSKWKLYREPLCRVEHRYRETLASLLHQWFWYGYGHPYVFKKHSQSGVQILLRRWRAVENHPATEDVHAYRYLGKLELPCFGYFFLGTFHLFHLSILMALGSVLYSRHFSSFSIFAFGLATLFGLNFLFSGFKLTQPSRSLAYSGVRYLLSFAFSLGGLMGGLRAGVVCLEDAFESNPK